MENKKALPEGSTLNRQLESTPFENKNQVTKETRLESYIKRPVTRANEILNVMGDERMTARQIATKMGFSDLNAVKPRLTELKKQGLINAVGKALDLTTGRNTAIYERSN